MLNIVVKKEEPIKE